jgi:hypothetical protein
LLATVWVDSLAPVLDDLRRGSKPVRSALSTSRARGDHEQFDPTVDDGDLHAFDFGVSEGIDVERTHGADARLELGYRFLNHA